MRQAEPLLEAAALIERQQSLRHDLAATQRIADRIIDTLELDPKSHDTVRGDLKSLLATAPIPETARQAMADELDRRLARQLVTRMLADDPVTLTTGVLGWTAAGQNSRSGLDPRFQPLAEAERRDMFERAMETAPG